MHYLRYLYTPSLPIQGVTLAQLSAPMLLAWRSSFSSSSSLLAPFAAGAFVSQCAKFTPISSLASHRRVLDEHDGRPLSGTASSTGADGSKRPRLRYIGAPSPDPGSAPPATGGTPGSPGGTSSSRSAFGGSIGGTHRCHSRVACSSVGRNNVMLCYVTQQQHHKKCPRRAAATLLL